jgi:hypothetical protein
MPAPKGNSNRQRSGNRAFLSAGRWPKGCAHDQRRIAEFRAELTAKVAEKYGEVSLSHELQIVAILRFEGTVRLLDRWQAKEPNLTLAERLQISRDICTATESRNKAFAKLGLAGEPGKPKDDWESFDARTKADSGKGGIR